MSGYTFILVIYAKCIFFICHCVEKIMHNLFKKLYKNYLGRVGLE